MVTQAVLIEISMEPSVTSTALVAAVFLGACCAYCLPCISDRERRKLAASLSVGASDVMSDFTA